MKVFIVGGTGYLGKRIVKDLSYDGTLLISVLYRSEIPNEPQDLPENVYWIHGDTTSPGNYENELKEVDILLYMGGINSPGIETDPQILHKENVENLSIFISCVKKHNPGVFIYLSDVCALGDTGNLSYDQPKENEEKYSCNYEKSKHEALKIVKASELNTIIAYVGPSYGNNDPGFLWKYMSLAAKGKLKRLVAPYHCFSPLHIKDLCEGILQLLIKGEDGQEYIICGEPIEFQNIIFLIYGMMKSSQHKSTMTGISATIYSWFSSQYNSEMVKYLCNASFAYKAYYAKKKLRWSHEMHKDRIRESFINAGYIKEEN